MLRAIPVSAAAGGGEDGGGGQVSVALLPRKRLSSALGIAAANGEVIPLVERRSAVPLTRTLRFATSPAPLLVSLVELVSGGEGAEAVDVSDAEIAEAKTSEPGRTVLRLAVREVPVEAAAMLIRVAVDSAGAIELSCLAEIEAGGGGDEEGEAPADAERETRLIATASTAGALSPP
jgi:hypothetical protein